MQNISNSSWVLTSCFCSGYSKETFLLFVIDFSPIYVVISKSLLELVGWYCLLYSTYKITYVISTEVPFWLQQSQFLEAPLVRQADGELKNNFTFIYKVICLSLNCFVYPVVRQWRIVRQPPETSGNPPWRVSGKQTK